MYFNHFGHSIYIFFIISFISFLAVTRLTSNLHDSKSHYDPGQVSNMNDNVTTNKKLFDF